MQEENSDPLGAEENGSPQPDSREALGLTVQYAKEAVEQHDAEDSRRRILRQELVRKHDRARQHLDARHPPLRPADATRAWLNTQRDERVKRAQLQPVRTGSALQQSFARRTGHGLGRKPQPPLFAT